MVEPPLVPTGKSFGNHHLTTHLILWWVVEPRNLATWHPKCSWNLPMSSSIEGIVEKEMMQLGF